MSISRLKRRIAFGTSFAIMAGMIANPAIAQDADTDAEAADEGTVITVIGSRSQRSADDSPAPVDIIGVEEFRQNASTDVQDLLRTSVPSFAVDQQPINDASTISRPANLRGLSPDNTLVLVNGKRRHRGSIITFLGGGIADGAQGVDIGSIPSAALQRVEVLRDGAASQYGSDAIAGVINFVLNDSSEGGFIEGQWGSTYDGDGDTYRISANIGLPIGDIGFANFTAEYGDQDGTSRSFIRPDVAALIAAGNTAAGDFLTINTFTDEVPQYWGQPDVRDDFKLFLNTGITLSDSAEFYAFGGYSERQVEGGFFYRNPTNRGGIYAGPTVDPVTGALDPNGVASVLVGDLDGLGVGGACPAGIPLTAGGGLIPDPTVLAQVTADDNCFSFVETIPGGFTPRFGGDVRDFTVAAGLRGEISDTLQYDISIVHGANRTDFFINNTLNPSLGPASPRDFALGSQEQIETTVDAGVVYAVPVGLASDLSIAVGGQYRRETFEVGAGDPSSFAIGPLADQGFGTSSNGFGGFPGDSSNSQEAYAAYLELDVDVTEALTLQGAARFEDYSTFGNTTEFKVAGLYRVSDGFSLRGAFSTGFHAPTAGQATITNVSTTLQNGILVDQGTLPFGSPAGELGVDFIESFGNGRPTLGAEDARNISFGAAFDLGPTRWTVDFYDIDLDGRVAPGAQVDFLAALNFAGGGTNFTTVNAALTGLDAAGVIDRADFVGLDNLQSFSIFTNSFSTSTQGIDVVGTWPFDLAGGDSLITLAANYNKTDVTDVGTINPIGAGRVAALENRIPNLNGNLTWSHRQGRVRGFLRANYFGGYDDTGEGVLDISPRVLVDAEIGYEVIDGFEVIAGVNNIFDTFPPEIFGGSGQRYATNSPFGFNGGSYYLRARFSF